MGKDDILTVNHYPSGLTSRQRGTSKTKYSITIKSEPLLIQTDAKALGGAPAEAIAEIYRERIRAISQTAKPATLKARQSALKAVIQGEAWAMKRYSGGRTGTRPPAQSDKLFHDSGRLLESIKVGATPQGWVVNIAANRLDPNTFNGGEAEMAKMVDRLKEFVPELGDAKALGDHLTFKKALKDTQASMMAKADARSVELKKQLMGQVFSIVRRVVG